ncbi:hypothetical protein [Afipia sp. GAS231]|uniref:hypothetical protein n=1 Tax=Afipia sp. GAS231 TaxID=1882747 RepID=UPI00087CE235|nr:hypothetical protein [Afipia sp. GAS231]SDO47894.1 hypothetical protein SAMN05444050_4236 [Afipia sp. GAS231]
MSTIWECAVRGEEYGSARFARKVGEILQRNSKDVSLHLAALLRAGRIPIETTAAQAEWAASQEAARILAAIGSRQVNPASVVRVSDRILAMAHQCYMTNGRARRDVSSVGPPTTFEAGLSTVVSAVWASNKRVTGLSIPPNVTMTWNEGGSVLYGTIDDPKCGVTALYSTERIPAPLGASTEAWDFVRTDSVGGSGFSSLELLGFAELVLDAVEATNILGYGSNNG